MGLDLGSGFLLRGNFGLVGGFPFGLTRTLFGGVDCMSRGVVEERGFARVCGDAEVVYGKVLLRGSFVVVFGFECESFGESVCSDPPVSETEYW